MQLGSNRYFALVFVFSCCICCLLPVVSIAQVKDSVEVQVRMFDFRGQRAQKAFVGAHSASKKEVIVVMLRGGDDVLVSQVKESMKGLIHSGYERLGLVVSDLLPEDTGSTIAIFSKGFTYALMEEVDFDATTKLHFYQLVRDVYRKDILSELD